VACTSAGASVTHEHDLETCEPSWMPRAAKPFFIPGVHSPPGAVRHVAAPELPSQKVKDLSRGTRGSTGAHISKEARSGAAGHVAAAELTLARRRCPVPRDT
jgi:hypothetical protein